MKYFAIVIVIMRECCVFLISCIGDTYRSSTIGITWRKLWGRGRGLRQCQDKILHVNSSAMEILRANSEMKKRKEMTSTKLWTTFTWRPIPPGQRKQNPVAATTRFYFAGSGLPFPRLQCNGSYWSSPSLLTPALMDIRGKYIYIYRLANIHSLN